MNEIVMLHPGPSRGVLRHYARLTIAVATITVVVPALALVADSVPIAARQSLGVGASAQAIAGHAPPPCSATGLNDRAILCLLDRQVYIAGTREPDIAVRSFEMLPRPADVTTSLMLDNTDLVTFGPGADAAPDAAASQAAELRVFENRKLMALAGNGARSLGPASGRGEELVGEPPGMGTTRAAMAGTARGTHETTQSVMTGLGAVPAKAAKPGAKAAVANEPMATGRGVSPNVPKATETDMPPKESGSIEERATPKASTSNAAGVPSAGPDERIQLNELGLADLAGRAVVDLSTDLQDKAAEPRFERADVGESVRRALEISYTLGAARARARSADAMVDVARGAFRPAIDLRMSHGREASRPGSQLDEVTGEPVVESMHNRGDSTAIFKQLLIDFSASAEWNRQLALSRSSALSMLDTRDQVMLEAVTAHLDLLRYKLSAEFASQHQRSLETLLSYVTQRVEAGGASEAEAERVKARAINARASVIEANGALESAMVTYRRLVGAVPVQVPTDDRFAPTDLPALDEALQRAIEHSPALQSRREQLAAIEREVEAASGQSMPKVHFEIGNYRTTNAGGRPGTSNDTRALLVMSMNLLNGGIDEARARAALARVEEARFRLRDAERRLEESLTVSFNALKAVINRYTAVRAEFDANMKVARAFREQLEAASRPLLDVLDAEERLYTSKVEMLRLIVLKATLELQVHRLIGDATLGGAVPASAVN